MNLLDFYSIVSSRLLTLILLFNLSFVFFLYLTSEFPQSIGSILEEDVSGYQSVEDVEPPAVPITEHPVAYDPSPEWLINVLNDDDLPCQRLPPPVSGRGYMYPPSDTVNHQTLQSKYLPFQHQQSKSPTPRLDSDLDLTGSCVDSAIADGALCEPFTGTIPKIDIVWTFANGSGVLHEKWRKVRQVQQELQRAGTLAPRAARLNSRRTVAGTEKKLFRCATISVTHASRARLTSS